MSDSTSSEKGQIDGVNTRDGTKDPGKSPPNEGTMSPEITGTVSAHLQPGERVPNHADDHVSIGPGLTSSMGHWPIHLGERDSGGGKFKNPE